MVERKGESGRNFPTLNGSIFNVTLPFSFQVSLRQTDMNLLCQLWSLNEQIQDLKKHQSDAGNNASRRKQVGR